VGDGGKTGGGEVSERRQKTERWKGGTLRGAVGQRSRKEKDFLWRADIAGWLNETAREKLTEKEAQEPLLPLSLSLCRRVLGTSTPARDRFFISLPLSPFLYLLRSNVARRSMMFSI